MGHAVENSLHLNLFLFILFTRLFSSLSMFFYILSMHFHRNLFLTRIFMIIKGIYPSIMKFSESHWFSTVRACCKKIFTIVGRFLDSPEWCFRFVEFFFLSNLWLIWFLRNFNWLAIPQIIIIIFLNMVKIRFQFNLSEITIRLGIWISSLLCELKFPCSRLFFLYFFLFFGNWLLFLARIWSQGHWMLWIWNWIISSCNKRSSDPF